MSDPTVTLPVALERVLPVEQDVAIQFPSLPLSARVYVVERRWGAGPGEIIETVSALVIPEGTPFFIKTGLGR